MLLYGVGYLGLFGLRFMRRGPGIFESGGEKEDAAGDFNAGSFPMDKKGCLVLGV